jgi:inosine-uridine nucleoside N-ribohydrolase
MSPQIAIFDTDYGPFIDDVFALGLLLNSDDLLDVRMIITTSENPTLSAKCVAKHLDIAGADIPVMVGSTFPPYDERGSVCGIPGLVGFALEEECADVKLPLIKNGLKAMVEKIMDSGRDDWWYIVVGGQTTLKDLILDFPEAASKIDTLIVMAGNWCGGFEPYPDVMAPTDETNIGCDPAAANIVLDRRVSPIRNVYYVPVEVADEIGGSDYRKFVSSANSGSNPGAAATLGFYRAWSAAARADPDVLVHAEAMTYDPETESTPQFDACAVMLALELLDDKRCDNRLPIFDFDAVHFLEAGEGVAFPESPRPAFSLHTGEDFGGLPRQCPVLTNYTFSKEDTPERETPVKITLGFKSRMAKESFYASMAARMAGDVSECA